MSTPGPSVVNYEIYTLEVDRWTFYARFSRAERDEAIEEAKQIERALMRGVRVVRDTYYPKTNTSEEMVVYVSDKSLLKPRQAPPVRFQGQGARGGVSTADTRPSRPGRAGHPGEPRSLGVLAKMLVVIAASLIGAGTVAAIVGAALSSMFPGRSMDADTNALILFSSFLVSFLIIAVPMSMAFIDWGGQGRREKAPLAATGPMGAPFMPAAPVRPAEASAPATPETKPAPDGKTPPPEEPPPEEAKAPEPPHDPILAATQAAIEPIPALPIPGAEPEAGAEAEAKPAEDGAGEPGVMAEASPKRDPALGLEERKITMMRFLSALLARVKTQRPALDSYNRFGIGLILAGAGEMLASKAGGGADDKRIILQSTIEVMGSDNGAQKLVERYDEYLAEPRYLTMVQAGRIAMEGFLSDNEAGLDQVLPVIDLWNRPQPAQAPSRIVTILFTDMVGSTDLTQSRGDQGAQELVRRHNAIVRQALAQYSGREIKHTGDGIMASFVSTANGVDAAVAIQRAVAMHGREHPDQPLSLRIGLDSGEPIEEEDDLFGTTVQLASRACAAARAGQIMCTNVVRELSAGKGHAFRSQGEHELKGFKEKIGLYEVVWQDTERAALGPMDADRPLR